LRALPLDHWPAEDRAAWASALRRPADIFEERGSAATLSPSTIYNLQAEYGVWLRFLLHHDRPALNEPMTARLDRMRVERFVRRLEETNSRRSCGTRLATLAQALRHLSPAQDWHWLKAISTRLIATSAPVHRPSFDLAAIYRAVLAKLEELEVGGPLDLPDAIAHRDALVIATLCEAPIRRRNLAQIRLGAHLVEIGETFSLVFGPAETKTGRSLDYPLSPTLSGHIRHHLERVRPLIPGADQHAGLWASPQRRPMTDSALYDAVAKRTACWFGRAINLHAFRKAAGSLHAAQTGRQIHLVRDLLGHARLDTSHAHYVEAQSRVAAARLQRIIWDRSDRSSRQ
jgi:integrase